MKKLRPLPKILKDTHDLWSIAIRKRDKKCVMCGTAEYLEAHHCIVHSARAGAMKFELDNGICLCRNCHIFIFHQKWGQRQGKEWYDRLSRIIDSRVSKERQEEIERLAHECHKWDRAELDGIQESLKKYVDTLG